MRHAHLCQYCRKNWTHDVPCAASHELRCYQCNYSKLHMDEQYGMAGEQLPGDGLGEGKPKTTRPLHTIKRVLRGKYTKGRSLIN